MKTLKKSLSVLLVVSMLLAFVSFAASAVSVTVNVRIEGISECLLYTDVSVDANASVLDAVLAADALSDDVTVYVTDGQFGPYIYCVNDDMEKTFGGWDGWCYRVNGVEPTVGIDSFGVKEGSRIVLYYGDPYGEGMQYPVVDTSSLAAGLISFKSSDTVYVDGEAVSVDNVVTGYTLSWTTETGAVVDLYPNSEGVVEIYPEYLTEGQHSIQISKYNAAGLPLVLRLAPDASVNVGDRAGESAAQENPVVLFIRRLTQFVHEIIDAIKEMIASFK